MENSTGYELFDEIQLGICIINQDYKVLFWNRTLEEWTNITKKEITGNSLSGFFPAIKEYSYSILIDEIFRGGPPAIFSSQLHKSLFPSRTHIDEKRVQNTVVKAIPGNTANEYYALFSIEDVTGLTKRIKEYKKMRDHALEEIAQRKRAEEKLIKSETELRETNAMKDKFFSIMAHDLKNPIGSFLNLSEVMFRTFDEFEKEEMKEFIEAMYESSQNLFKLLENLLTWSRAQTGKIDFNPGIFDLSSIVASNISLFRLNAENKKITLENHLDSERLVYADVNMINTVIRNLVSNALKFTHEGGKITTHSTIHGDMLELSVSDTGVGMPEKILKNLFRIDTNHSSVGTSNETGTGLGLILCKEFVNKNGGEIRVESEVGKGSTFSFTVPIKHHPGN